MLDWNQFRALTFDCYGTLIDWETGIIQAIRPLLAAHGINASDEQILETFARQETYGELTLAPQSTPPLLYKEIMIVVLHGYATTFGFTPSPEELISLRNSVIHWPAFADAPAALQALKQRYKLGVLSNIDDTLFAVSAQKLQVAFDWVVTAEQVGSYKPTERNFAALLERLALPKEQVLHVAQSRHHDIRPAREFGLSTVWINRRQGKESEGASMPVEAVPDVEVPDLRSLVELMGV